MSVSSSVPTYRAVFDRLPQALVVLDRAGRVVAHNPAAAALVGPALERRGLRCCELVGCRCRSTALAHGCLTELAVAGRLEAGPFELDLTVNGGGRVTISATPLADDVGVVLELHPAQPPAPASTLQIATLGRTRLELDGVALDGEWLQHRPGQVLKYLVCARGRFVPVEEFAETLWPMADRTAIVSLRQAVHTLRGRLEPQRVRPAESRYVLARKAGYELNLAAITVDADAFERLAQAGLAALGDRRLEDSASLLEEAAALYGGDFIADEPYADWVLTERERLRGIVANVLRGLADAQLALGDVAGASAALARLAELEPLDLGAQRDLIALMVRSGRHGEAARRYDTVRRRFKRAFGEEPSFDLAQLAAGG